MDFIAVGGMTQSQDRPVALGQGVIQRAVKIEVFSEVEDLIWIDDLVLREPPVLWDLRWSAGCAAGPLSCGSG